MSSCSHDQVLETEAETAALAARCAQGAVRGDVFLLRGDIGAGKSTFSRAFIRARLASPREDVPSPTFTIVQTYEHQDGDIWHCDLYRLGDVNDVIELGLDEAFDTSICLIEWPDRMGQIWPTGAVVIDMAAGQDAHHLRINAPAQVLARLLSTNG